MVTDQGVSWDDTCVVRLPQWHTPCVVSSKVWDSAPRWTYHARRRCSGRCGPGPSGLRTPGWTSGARSLIPMHERVSHAPPNVCQTARHLGPGMWRNAWRPCGPAWALGQQAALELCSPQPRSAAAGAKDERFCGTALWHDERKLDLQTVLFPPCLQRQSSGTPAAWDTPCGGTRSKQHMKRAAPQKIANLKAPHTGV